MNREKTKSRHMTEETFAELMTSAKQALAYERGEVSGHRVTQIAVPRPPRPMSSADIARIRQQLKCSQSVFARVLNVSPKTVQAWEQGIRVPSGSSGVSGIGNFISIRQQAIDLESTLDCDEGGSAKT